MAHGHPDWGESGIISTVFRVADWGEIAARLGSVVTYHRGGNVVSIDDFNSGCVPGDLTTTGVGSQANLSTRFYRSAPYSVLLYGGPAAGRSAQWNKSVNYLTPGKHGIEIHYRYALPQPLLYLYYTILDGSQQHGFGIRINFQTGVVSYIDSLGAWTTLTTVGALVLSVFVFHAIKLIVDTESDSYVRLLVDQVAYDMLGLTITPLVMAGNQSIAVAVNSSSIGAGATTTHIDDVIITQNEV